WKRCVWWESKSFWHQYNSTKIGQDLHLPIARAGIPRRIVELISFFVREGRDPNGHQGRGDDQDKNSATQTANQARSRGSRLRVAEGAALRLGEGRHTEKRGAYHQEANATMAQASPPRGKCLCKIHLRMGLMCSRRKLSDQIMFI